jgi:hypothetical protein
MVHFFERSVVLLIPLSAPLRLDARQRVENDKTRVLDRFDPIGNVGNAPFVQPPPSRRQLAVLRPLFGVHSQQLGDAGLQPTLTILASAVEDVAVLYFARAEARAILRSNGDGDVEGQPALPDLRPAGRHTQIIGD